MTYQKIDVDSSIGPVGASVKGVNLSEDLTEETLSEITDAWLKHHVLFFPDQDLTPAEQADFAACFGSLDTYPFMESVESHPNVIPIIKEPDAEMNFGGGWHTDTSYLATPPKATLLYAVQVPDQGGDTLFANAAAAYEDLSEGMRSWLDTLTGIFSPKLVHGSKGAYNSGEAKQHLGNAYGGDSDFAEGEVEHPIIRTHDESGIKSIYSGKFHTHRIKGWTREESVPIFDFLQDHLTQEKYITRFQWTKGAVAMWDNRCLFHNAMNDYQGQRRHMHRVIVQGDTPQ